MADSGAAEGDRPAWAALETLVERFDAGIFDVGRRRARIHVRCGHQPLGDVLIEYGQARLIPADGKRPDAVLSADAEVWASAVRDGGLSAFRAGRIRIRRDLHLGVGFLAATAPASALSGLRIHHLRTAIGRISVAEAGRGDPVILIHGLGATKASFLPTVGALARRTADRHRPPRVRRLGQADRGRL